MESMRAYIRRLEDENARMKSVNSKQVEELERARRSKVEAEIKHSLLLDKALASQRDAESALDKMKSQAGPFEVEGSRSQIEMAFKIERESMQSRIEGLENQ